jgi:hypothetical protein
MHGTSNAFVIAAQLNCVATAAGRAMEKILAPAYPANPTSIAVKYSFRQVIIKKFTIGTKVLSK